MKSFCSLQEQMMMDEYHQTNSQLDNQVTTRRERRDRPGQEGSEYVDPSKGEYDQAGELQEVRKATPTSEYSDAPPAGKASEYADPWRGEYSQAGQQEQGLNTTSSSEYSDRPSDYDNPNGQVSSEASGNCPGPVTRLRHNFF